MKPENKSGKRKSGKAETGDLRQRSFSVFHLLFPPFRFPAFRFAL
jgi:hypothetical protein